MTDGVVLHTQKVAGISGSEAHLLQLLPDLRARGWDVRFLMLHEDEPGAWEFADELRTRGVPVDDIRLRADVDPIAFGEVAATLARVRPRILHTHLVHADVYGQLAGSMTRVPLRLSTKHGFNEFREGRWFGVADRSVGSLAHVHIAISQGLAQYLAETEGFEEEDFEIVHYGISAAGDAKPYAGTTPRLLCIGRLIPPLLLFASAARRLRFVTIGFLQYLGPTLQFLLAVLVFGEPFNGVTVASFAMIWLAVGVFLLDSLLAYRRAAPPLQMPLEDL